MAGGQAVAGSNLAKRGLDVESRSGNDVDARLDADVLQERGPPIESERRVVDDGAAAGTTKRRDAVDDGRLGFGVVEDQVVGVAVPETF